MELKKLNQTGSVDEYMDHFERVKARMLLENRQFSVTDFIDSFISGLKEEIIPFVKAFKFLSLEDAFEYALHMKTVTDNQFKKLKVPYKSIQHTPSTTMKPTLEKLNPVISKPTTYNQQPRNALIDQRRSLGLCFKCGDKYFPGHQWKVRVQMLLCQEEMIKEINNLEESKQLHSEAITEFKAEETIISMHATTSNPQVNTMSFKGQIGDIPVFALIDSRSTHNFIDPNVL